MERRYDIDWLRVIAIGLLLIYHIAIGFQPWGVFIGFIQNSEPMEWIWTPMALLNIWRIPLLFFVSGMGLYFAMQRRSWKVLLLERSKRILLPFLFGMCAIVPLHVMLWQNYYHQDLSYHAQPSHLWFLGNIFVYVLIFLPLFYLLKRHSGNKFHHRLQRIMSTPFGILLLMLAFIIEAEWVRPDSFEIYALNAHGFWIGLAAFFSGFVCVYSGKGFWQNIDKWKWLLLLLSFGLYLFRIADGNFSSPFYLMAIESISWILTALGLAYRYLNKPSKRLSYLSEAAYPVYIIHMFYLYLGSWLLFPLAIGAEIKLLLLIGFTFAGCMLSYEYLIRRISWLRIMFGLKIAAKSPQPDSPKSLA